MKQRDRTHPPERRIRLRGALAVFAVLASFAAQAALPALHAGQTARPEHAATLAPATGSSLELAGSCSARPAHDPATCPVCQSLLRISLGVLSAACEQPGARQGSAPLARPDETPALVALGGHPARGPPALASISA